MSGQLWGPGFEIPNDPARRPPVLTRVYRGSPTAAGLAFQRDAAALAASGYAPAGQQYVPGSWGGRAFALGVLLILALGLGLLVLGYLIVVKPAGQLTVWYQLRAPAYAVPDRQVFPVAAPLRA